MKSESHLVASEDPAAASQPDTGTGDMNFLVFLTVIFTAGAAAVLAVALNMGSPAVAGTSPQATVSAAQPAETERFVPFHERYGVEPGAPEYQPPTF